VSFRVRLTRDAEADLERLFDFVLDRELERDGGDLDLAEQALVAIRAGYVAFFEIFGSTDVVVSAVRQQLEEDYLAARPR
jgi:plasmid stabilization system protein ParE